MATGPNVYKPGLLQIRPQWSVSDVSGHKPECVLWFTSGNSTTPTLANLQSIGNTFDPLLGQVFADYGASNNTYTGSVTTDWSSNTGLQYNSVGTFTPKAGTQGTVTASAQVCLLISYQIGVRYKGGHPRTYLPYVAQTSLTGTSGDEVQAAIQTSVLGAWNAMISGMKGNATLGGQTQVIYRHRNNVSLAQTYQFATFTVNAQTATQRRRIRRVPHH